MYPRPIQKLIEYFQKLPGIGPKQAAKFAFRALGMTQAELDAFGDAIRNIRREVSLCSSCSLSYSKDDSSLCPICRNPERDSTIVCVVETERDAYTIEKANPFRGVYHVIGKVELTGDVAASPPLTRLVRRVLSIEKPEVVIATNTTTDGRALALFIEHALKQTSAKVSRLGRGLSSGIEIEYADKETLSDAFQNRK